MQPAVEAGAREAREGELGEDEPARGKPHAPRESRVPKHGKQPAARPEREEEAEEREARQRNEEAGTRREARAGAGREQENERRERESREISPAAFERAEKERVGRRKDEVDEIRRSDRPRERLSSRHAREPAGGRGVFEEGNRGGRREARAENEPSQEARGAPNAPSGRAGLVASRRERDESRRRGADGSQSRLAAQKRESEGDRKPRRRAASRRVPCRQEQPRQERRGLEIVVDERERKKTAAPREHGRAEESARARRAEAGQPGRHPGGRDREVEGDAEEGAPGAGQNERQVSRVENSCLKLGEPRLAAPRERVPERYPRGPARGRVGLHRPEEVGEIATGRHTPRDGAGNEKEARERESQGAAQERRPSRRHAA